MRHSHPWSKSLLINYFAPSGIEIDGAIGPATVRYVKEALTTAGERRVDVVILRLNTPGGLATSMREIIADVLGSSVPVIGYVAPSGAHAASAGTYILYATHIAAMAPGTNLGAATPVQISGPLPGLPGSAPDKDGKDKKDGAQQPALKDAMTILRISATASFVAFAHIMTGRPPTSRNMLATTFRKLSDTVRSQ